ncbi:hypothetical protein AB6Q56_14590 [Dechloromonas sp. ARDL1]|uniref:hypothetical protein n=1 Tax=Dechloromonas sp. ARDL1 TaxID=3322121 RepID=UPI003DA765D7
MDTKHTPGPWEAISNVVHGPMKDGGYLIAECPANIGNRIEDARLIAAAPELLDALIAITDESVCLKSAIVEQARAAIAKATGA